MTEWKDQPATNGTVYGLRKLVEEVLTEVKRQRTSQSVDKPVARMPYRSADLCEDCHGAGYTFDGMNADSVVECECRLKGKDAKNENGAA